MLNLVLNSKALGISGFEVSRRLRQDNPGVFASEKLLSEDTLVIHPLNLNQERTETVTRRLREVLQG